MQSIADRAGDIEFEDVIVRRLARVAVPELLAIDRQGNRDNYIRCLRYVKGLSNGDDAAYDRGRRACNKGYYPNKPGVDY